jgi:uncharacterized protein
MPEQMPVDFEAAIAQFNQGQFYACHDLLELIWIDAMYPEKDFYQGLLQIAVGLYHLGNHNWHGSMILLGEGISRLRDFQPLYLNINVSQLVLESVKLLTFLQKSRSEGITNLDPDFKMPLITLIKWCN